MAKLDCCPRGPPPCIIEQYSPRNAVGKHLKKKFPVQFEYNCYQNFWCLFQEKVSKNFFDGN